MLDIAPPAYTLGVCARITRRIQLSCLHQGPELGPGVHLVEQVVTTEPKPISAQRHAALVVNAAKARAARQDKLAAKRSA